MRVTNLKNTRVDDMRNDGGTGATQQQYYGCGKATLALLHGEPVGLLYRMPDGNEPTELPKHDETRHGVVSCWEFVER